jgi:hypothetical protein
MRHDDGGVLVDDQHRAPVAVEQRHPSDQRRAQRLPTRFSTLCQVISRATAPAAAMPSISAGLIEFSTRQHVESEATGPNTSP